MQRAVAEKAVTENPELKIFFHNSPDITEPWIEATYSDGTVLNVPTKKYSELEILLKIGKHTLALRQKDL